MLIYYYGFDSIAPKDKGDILCKNTIRKAVAEGKLFRDVYKMVENLEKKFASNEHPQYNIETLEQEELDGARKEAREYVYGTIDGPRVTRSLSSLHMNLKLKLPLEFAYVRRARKTMRVARF